jgi:NAD(P)-dependent dehydrogenase (short-subunit alcohol dehydrogenase family)
MDYFKKSLEGKVGIVSGAGMGQGKAVVKLLLEEGARVIAFSRTGNKPDIRHDNLKVMRGDSSDLPSLREIRKEVEKDFGKLNFLYNNHGLFSPAEEEFSGEKAMEFFNRNVISSINTVQVFHPLMKDGGSIVNVGASPGLFHLSSLEYAVSKRSVEELTRKMASMLRSKNIRVNAIMPGSVDSSVDVEELAPFRFKKLEGKKDVSTLEIAYAALFLISDLSYGINGQSIAVDGGLRL